MNKNSYGIVRTHMFEFEKKTQFFSLLVSIQLSSKAGFIRSMIKYMDKLKKEINKSKKKIFMRFQELV